jgi:sterol desaturase/sphingolipid hydroxylase (fatty acid hydroxylase superfamily)
MWQGALLVGAVVAVMAWEWRCPRRVPSAPRSVRWLGNAALGALAISLTAWLAPLVTVGAAGLASAQAWGLLHQAPLPWIVSLSLSVLALDLVLYAQHRVLHASRALWRLHRVHHADVDVDATTALRFHPAESLISRLAPAAAVLLLGAPVEAVILSEVLVTVSGVFTHGNARLPAGVDRALRRLVVTPDMHRIHHSSEQAETDCNFGVALSLWDRVFGTYRREPGGGHAGMTVGLAELRDLKYLTLPWMLALPFVGGRR